MRRPKMVEKASAAGRAIEFMPPLSPEPSPHPAPAIWQHTHRLVQALISLPRHNVDTDRGHVAIHGRALEHPHPIHQGILLAFEPGAVEDVDGDHDVAAFAEID